MSAAPILRKFPNDPPRPYVARGEGCWFETEDGRRILDLTAGYTSCAVLGFSHPAVREAMHEQMERFCHMDYNLWSNRQLDELACILVSRAPAGLDRVYFGGCNGSDAIEAALKLSYQVHHARGEGRRTFYLSREQSYHGSSLHAMSVSNFPLFDVYQPVMPREIASVPEHNPIRHRHDGETLEEYARRSADALEERLLEIGPERVAAFVGETMMGSIVGDVPPAPGYWQRVREICDRHGVHLILDEIYCGLGRSGRVYCCEWDGITPDFVCVGKNLAAGYAPLSAVIASGDVEDAVASGTGRIQLGHNYQGYSLGVAAALATQRIVHTDTMLARIQALGARLRTRLQDALGTHPFFREVRGRGLLVSLEYDCTDQHLFGLTMQRTMEHQHSVMVNAKWHRVSFVPAYVISDAELALGLDRFVETFERIAERWHCGARETLVAGALGGVQVAR